MLEHIEAAELLFDHMVSIGEFDESLPGDIEEAFLGEYIRDVPGGVVYEDSVGSASCIDGKVSVF